MYDAAKIQPARMKKRLKILNTVLLNSLYSPRKQATPFPPRVPPRLRITLEVV